MIKGKLLKRDCKEFKSIKIEDFPQKEDIVIFDVLSFFRHTDNSWFEELIKDLNLKNIDSVTARKVVTASLRKMMEAKKR